MGANAQTSVPLYVAAEVLTASDMNISAGTGVPVFATTVTRDAAFGGASEKILAEGQLAYIEASDVVQYYTGSAWATVGPTSAVGLTFINGATFSAANTVSLAASSFTSTYQNYLLQVTLSASSASGILQFRYRASGTDYSGSTYNTGGLLVDTAGTIANDGLSGASQTLHKVGYFGSADYLMGEITLFNPQEAANSRFTSNSSGVNSNASAVAHHRSGGIVYQNTQYDAITLICSGVTTITGNYRLYGYSKS
jgi:hypothetical protein